ncbi:MAG: hypothetical protein IPK59_22235 [Rhodospirillaceae bacterium]|nr:hypothetical protein [Rhodospirillaceae bacterium]
MIQHNPMDLRAKAAEYRIRAASLRDEDLRGQYAELASRYQQLAERSTGNGAPHSQQDNLHLS